MAVAGIAILSLAYLFPVILRASGEGIDRAALSIVLTPTVSLVMGLAVWLVFYFPLSVVADKLATTTAARMKWSAVLCSTTMIGLSLGLSHRFELPLPFLLVTSVVLGAGGALYSFFKVGFATELSLRRQRES